MKQDSFLQLVRERTGQLKPLFHPILMQFAARETGKSCRDYYLEKLQSPDVRVSPRTRDRIEGAGSSSEYKRSCQERKSCRSRCRYSFLRG